MASTLQLRRGTKAQNDVFTGADGETTVNTDSKSLRTHDGVRGGGYEIGMAQANSMADLRTHTPAIGATRYLLQHTTAGDGGHGVFRAAIGGYVAAQDNNGTVIVVGANAWVREYGDQIDVKWFGLQAGIDAGVAINAAIPLFGKEVVLTGSYFITTTIDLQGKSANFEGATFTTDATLTNNILLVNAGTFFTGGNYTLSNAQYIIDRTSFVKSYIYNIKMRGGTLLRTSGIIVGGYITNVQALASNLLIESTYTGAPSTTLTTENIYLDYCQGFMKFADQLTGHYMRNIVIENANGVQFSMTSVYHDVDVENMWLEVSAAGRSIDMNTGVGQQFMWVSSKKISIHATIAGSITNTKGWLAGGVSENGNDRVTGDNTSAYYKVDNLSGVNYVGDLQYSPRFDYKFRVPDAASVATSTGCGYTFQVGKGSNGQANGKFSITDGTNLASIGVGASGLSLPNNIVFSTGEKHIHGYASLPLANVLGTIYTLPASSVIRLKVIVGAADRIALLFSGSIITNSTTGTIYSDTGVVSSRIAMAGLALQVSGGWPTYGLSVKFSLEILS